MKINSAEQLQQIFDDNICSTELKEENYSKTIYVKESTFYNLIKFDLFFEPYISLAKDCSMETLQIMKSAKTNRFYIGFVNLGGHGAVYEIRAVRLKEIKNIDYLKKMFNNYGQGLDWGIDIHERYEV